MLDSINKNKNLKFFISLFIFVLVVGQSIAKVSNCEMQLQASEQHASHIMGSNDAHAGHDMDLMKENSTDHTQMCDCCIDECQCAQNTCASFLTMMANKNVFLTFLSSQPPVVEISSSIYSQVLSLSLRPPIIC